MILTKDKTRLKIFEDGILVNKELPKHKRVKKYIDSKQKHYGEINCTEEDSKSLSSTLNYEISSTYALKEKVDFDAIAKLGIEDINNYIAEHGLEANIYGYGSYKNYSYGNTITLMDESVGPIMTDISHLSLFKRIYIKTKKWVSNIYKKSAETIDNYGKIDVTDFFSYVKLISKENSQEYVDRVTKYLTAIHRAQSNGQTALIETLLKNMIFNKYDAVLNANGYHYVIKEGDVVNFAKKARKGLSLTYINNYIKNIPDEVSDKINVLNELNIFDNYVILHYDPNVKAYKETEQQKARRKDPILFGVCCGNNKLYYIADWTDEYCDLTLDEFVDTIGTTKEHFKNNDFLVED